MKNIQFLEIGMENYGPYIEPMIITIENNKIILITGPNGIGKTMCLDALPFTLYGTTTKGIKGDDAVNNVVGKNCKTWVKFNLDSDKYLVTRYQAYSKLGNTVIINKNGIDILKGSKESVPFIEKLICSEKAFMNTRMFGQRVKDFFTDLTDSNKKEIFRKILDLEQQLVYYKKADEKLKLLSGEKETLEREYIINQKLIEDTNQQIDILKESKRKFYEGKESQIKDIKTSIENETRLLNAWNNTLKELKAKDINIDEISVEISDLFHKIKNIDSNKLIQISELENKATEKILELKTSASKEKESINEKYKLFEDELKTQKEQIISEFRENEKTSKDEIHNLLLSKSSYQSQSNELIKRINEISKNIFEKNISVCPTCEQDVNEIAIDKLKNKINNYKKEISENQEKIKEIDNNVELLNNATINKNKILYEKQKDVDNKLAEINKNKRDEITTLEQKLKDKEKQVQQIVISQKEKINIETEKDKENYNIRYKELVEINNKNEKIKSDILNAENEIKEINYNIRTAQNNIKQIEEDEFDKTQINNYLKKERDYFIILQTIKNKLTEKDNIIKIIEFWKTGFSSSGIPSMLIDEAIPFMNEKISNYLEMISNGRYIVSFDTLAETKKGEIRDKISVRVLDTYTKANNRVQLSGGQTRIVDIAAILTLGDLQSMIQNVSFNILLFDEIFDSLDDENIGYVSKVLTKLKKDKCIFLISHTNQDQVECDEHLKFRK